MQKMILFKTIKNQLMRKNAISLTDFVYHNF